MTGAFADDDDEAVDRAARLALLRFGFALCDTERVDRLPQGIKNLNYRVHAGGQEWVLKCHQVGAAEKLAFSHRLELTLADAGFPVARLQRTSSGSTCVQTDAGIFTLHTWVDGQQISIDERDSAHGQHPALAAELGSMLGVLHRQGSAAASETPRVVDAGRLLTGPRRTAASIRHGRPRRFRKTLRLRLKGSKGELDRWILRNLAGLYRDAASVGTPLAVSKVDPSDVVLAHNDLNWENLIFDPSFAVIAVIDFDNASLVPRVLDVGAAAAVLVGADETRLGQFLEAYAEAAGEPVDREAVQLGMRWKCLQSILWSIDAYLSGRVADTELLETWCTHLHECMRVLDDRGSEQGRASSQQE